MPISFSGLFRRVVVMSCVAFGFSRTIPAADWPQWQGPGRDGIWRETGTVEQIPAAGLPVRWRIPIEGGYAGPAVVGGRVFVTDYVQRDGELANDPGSRTLLAGNERVLCLDATTGQVLWKHEYDCPYSISYAAGPRCTPTVQDGRVYIVGAQPRSGASVATPSWLTIS
jgi:outer membrane protein assembly factor BamB